MIELDGFRILEDKNMVDRKQNRTHRKKRINKKWAKRYGVTITPSKDIMRMGFVLVMHPTVAEEIKKQSMKVEIS